MPIQDSGYLIVMRASAMLRDYSQGRVAREHPELLQQLREALGFLDPAAYRGMGRWPLDPYPSLNPATIDAFRGSGIDMDSDRAARIRFWELVGEERPDDYEERLLSTPDEAREVWGLLDTPSDWEILHVAVAPLERTERTLGYDLGWWGGEFYSLISDCAIAPTWHPPDPDDFGELAGRLRLLNQHVLFETPEDALGFKSYYKTKPWAEAEDYEGAFRVARIDRV
jgi:hypothetical protein